MSGAGSILPSGAVLPSYPEIPKSFQSREDSQNLKMSGSNRVTKGAFETLIKILEKLRN